MHYLPNHLVSGAQPGPTDLSSGTALVLLVGQQTLERANPAPFVPGTEQDRSINQPGSGYWLLAGDEKASSGSLSGESGCGLRQCGRKGTECGSLRLRVAPHYALCRDTVTGTPCLC